MTRRRPPLRFPSVIAAATCVVWLLALPGQAAERTAADLLSDFESAWKAASAKKVTALMEPKGRLRIKLLAPRESGGTWTLDQAVRGLESYFGERGVSNPALTDVTPKKQRGKTVRLYDYSYRPHGDDPRTTRLTVTVAKDAKQQWVLATVIESPKP